MELQIQDWFNDNILSTDMYMWSIKAVIILSVIALAGIIFGKYKKEEFGGKLDLIAKMAFEVIKGFASVLICMLVYGIYSKSKISIATLVVVLLAIIQIFDSTISIIEIILAFKFKTNEERLSDLEEKVSKLERGDIDIKTKQETDKF